MLVRHIGAVDILFYTAVGEDIHVSNGVNCICILSHIHRLKVRLRGRRIGGVNNMLQTAICAVFHSLL